MFLPHICGNFRRYLYFTLFVKLYHILDEKGSLSNGRQYCQTISVYVAALLQFTMKISKNGAIFDKAKILANELALLVCFG
jgi:hypothetical protein